MAINDPIRLEYYERRKTYILKQGNSTFFDGNTMREWDTPQEAINWALSCGLIDQINAAEILTGHAD